MKTLVSVYNDRISPLTFNLEPWGQDYTVLPKESYDIRFKAKFMQRVSATIIVNEDNTIQL